MLHLHVKQIAIKLIINTYCKHRHTVFSSIKASVAISTRNCCRAVDVPLLQGRNFLEVHDRFGQEERFAHHMKFYNILKLFHCSVLAVSLFSHYKFLSSELLNPWKTHNKSVYDERTIDFESVSVHVEKKLVRTLYSNLLFEKLF